MTAPRLMPKQLVAPYLRLQGRVGSQAAQQGCLALQLQQAAADAAKQAALLALHEQQVLTQVGGELRLPLGDVLMWRLGSLQQHDTILSGTWCLDLPWTPAGDRLSHSKQVHPADEALGKACITTGGHLPHLPKLLDGRNAAVEV